MDYRKMMHNLFVRIFKMHFMHIKIKLILIKLPNRIQYTILNMRNLKYNVNIHKLHHYIFYDSCLNCDSLNNNGLYNLCYTMGLTSDD